MVFLTPSDFVGKFQLHRGMYDTAKIETYIERYEKKYLVQLFGVELYNEFMGDLGGSTPKSPNFLTIFEPFNEQLMFNEIAQSEGILDMLKGFIYFEYAKDLYNQMTPFGQVMPTSENSQNVPTLNNLMYTRYNESVKTYRAIQAYMLYNQGSPTGQVIEFWFPNIGNGYLQNYYQAAWINGSGTGFQCDVMMNLIGAVYTNTVTNAGTGYVNSMTPSATTGGAGSGCTLLLQTNGGGVTLASPDNSGQGYSVGDVLTIQDGNNDATISVDSLGTGSVKEFKNIERGINYQVGDMLELDANDPSITNAIMEVLYIGKGDYRLFAGKNLEYAYWL